jgi:zinc transport system ATP-binding protein
MSILSCRSLCFAYDGHEVLSDINFEINAGSYLCIVGENGAGKSTLLKGILRLKKPHSGEIIYGDGLKDSPIGYLPQQTSVQRDFPASVSEVVLSGCLSRHPGKHIHIFYDQKDRELVSENLKRMGISDLSGRCYRELSGGQQQRVLLARALCASGTILLLDEPVTGLDPAAASDMYQLISRLNREDKITVIMVSHDVKEAVPYASHILHLGHKQLFFGTSESYRENDLGRRFLA